MQATPSVLKLIRTKGLISVSEYMKYILTNPIDGYYGKLGNVKNDFITSPEISQIFGEIVSVWMINQWILHFKNINFNVVELGPGNGSLCLDVLRTLRQFPSTFEYLNLYNLYEISPNLTAFQQNKLCHFLKKIKWLNDFTYIRQITGPSFYIANEFFDALPINKYEKDGDKWREVMVHCDYDNSLHFVLNSIPTVVPNLILRENDPRLHVEISFEIGHYVNKICHHIQSVSGIALICDYGHMGEKGDTFRAFKNHTLCDPLHDPSNCDLTADVDFDYIIRLVNSFNLKISVDEQNSKFGPIEILGPIFQSDFLVENGAKLRLEMLLRSSKNQDSKRQLIKDFETLIDPSQMGERYKFLILKSSSSTIHTAQ